MRAVPKAEMARGVTADVEHIGVCPLLLIAVRRRVQTSTRDPAGISIPPISVRCSDFRLNARNGDSCRSTSLIALGSRDGSARSVSHRSGCEAKGASALAIPLIVVSSDGTR